MAKVHVAGLVHKAADVAIQINGARGYSTDTPLEWIYRYARQARLVDGADEVHKMVLDRYLQQWPFGSPLLPFHQVFARFRFAVIFVGIGDRVRNGTAAAADADSYAPLAARFARRARDIIWQTEGSRR